MFRITIALILTSSICKVYSVSLEDVKPFRPILIGNPGPKIVNGTGGQSDEQAQSPAESDKPQNMTSDESKDEPPIDKPKEPSYEGPEKPVVGPINRPNEPPNRPLNGGSGCPQCGRKGCQCGCSPTYIADRINFCQQPKADGKCRGDHVKHFSYCGTACPRYCFEPFRNDTICSNKCVRNVCQCEEGYTRRLSDCMCVEENDCCSCVNGGQGANGCQGGCGGNDGSQGGSGGNDDSSGGAKPREPWL